MTDETTKLLTEELSDGNKNVRLTIAYDNEEEDAIQVNFREIMDWARRLFVLWLCCAVAVGSLSGAAAILAQQHRLVKEARAVVSVNYGSDKEAYIAKIKSPVVLEEAIAEEGLDLKLTERFRGAIEISGIIPDGALDEMTMLYSIIDQTGSNAGNTVRNLLNTSYQMTRFIVSFDYLAVDLTREEGINFLNTLLRSFQDYLSRVYDSNAVMGNVFTILDYQDYDYAEAVSIFSDLLDNISYYIGEAERDGNSSFRSTKTGLSFQDLRQAASLLREVDLDWVSSYIIIHSVSKQDPEEVVSYYEWRVENLTRSRSVQETRLNSLSESISAYEKDPILIAVADGNTAAMDNAGVNAYYDSMIQEKLSAQASVASYTRSIQFYESVIAGFQNTLGIVPDAEAEEPSDGESGAEGASEAAYVGGGSGKTLSNPRDVAIVERDLASLNEKINVLIENVLETLNEFYEETAFASGVRVLVPASAADVQIISKVTVIIVAAAEMVALGFYLCFCFFKGISLTEEETGKSSPRKP